MSSIHDGPDWGWATAGVGQGYGECYSPYIIFSNQQKLQANYNQRQLGSECTLISIF